MKWRSQRRSARRTPVMLISVFSPMKLSEFRALWRKHVDADAGAKVFFNLMTKADAIAGTAGGKIIEQLSLLDDYDTE